MRQLIAWGLVLVAGCASSAGAPSSPVTAPARDPGLCVLEHEPTTYACQRYDFCETCYRNLATRCDATADEVKAMLLKLHRIQSGTCPPAEPTL